jgi:hypothetical protein
MPDALAKHTAQAPDARAVRQRRHTPMQFSRGQRPVPVPDALAAGIAVGVVVAVNEPHPLKDRRESCIGRANSKSPSRMTAKGCSATAARRMFPNWPCGHRSTARSCAGLGVLPVQPVFQTEPTKRGAPRIVPFGLLRNVQCARIVAQNRLRLLPQRWRAFVRKHHFRQKFASLS